MKIINSYACESTESPHIYTELPIARPDAEKKNRTRDGEDSVIISSDRRSHGFDKATAHVAR